MLNDEQSFDFWIPKENMSKKNIQKVTTDLARLVFKINVQTRNLCFANGENDVRLVFSIIRLKSYSKKNSTNIILRK